MDVAPGKARKRREDAARDARVERWAEDSGNAALMGRELPPAEVLAADQRITAWAHELRTAGLDGSMDQLRARAYLDLLLGKDSRPRPGRGGPAQQDVGAGGFAVRGTLTVPLADLTGAAERAGEMGGIGPVDPWLARDLAAAAARNPRTTWCVTVTDEQGHAVGHGCARPEPARETRTRETGETRGGGRGAGRAGIRLHPPGARGTAGRVRDLAAAHPRRRPRPDRRTPPDNDRGLRSPVRGQRPRSGSEAAAPGPDPARHLHQPGLPQASQPVRLRAQHPARSGRPDLPVQWRSEVSA